MSGNTSLSSTRIGNRNLMVTICLSLVCNTNTTTGVCSATILEVWVVAGLLSGYPTSGIIDQHLLKEIKTIGIKIRAERYAVIALPLGERSLVVWEASLVLNTRPVILGRGT